MKKYIWIVVAVVVVVGGTAVAMMRKHDANNTQSAAKGPSSLTVSELGIKFALPANLRDLNYKIGNGPEEGKAAEFSDTRLADVGGESCKAGNHVGVSSFPLGEVVVSEETPDKVAAEVAENPDDGLGEFITKVGDRYLYYNAPPAEPCSQDPQAQQLQKDGSAALKQALKNAEAVGPSTRD